MKRKILALLMSGALTFSAFTATLELKAREICAAEKILAFPGAEGGGMYASGGRGGEVYVVTTLDDYMDELGQRMGLGQAEEPIKGSLRDALSKGNRTVVFNVSGNIELKCPLEVKRKNNITVAGQTAPGDGITVTGFNTNFIESENLIVRYMRFRTGSKNILKGDSMDALYARRNNNIIFDHISASWSTDETVSSYQNTDSTMQWSIVSESLAMSGHSKGRHGYGVIFGALNGTFHHNIVANHSSRCPRVSCGYGGWSDTGELIGKEDADHIGVNDMRNNVFYNWNDYPLYGSGWAETNVINNYYKVGPATQKKRLEFLVSTGEDKKKTWYHVSGNVIEGGTNDEEITNNNSVGLIAERKVVGTEFEPVISDTPYKTAVREAVGNEGTIKTVFDDGTDFADLINTQTAREAYDDVLAKAGATLPRRDANDARIINEIKEGKGKLVNKEYETGGLPVRDVVNREADFDKDMDGIADEWELANGLDPTNPNDSIQLASDGSGYTNLENYINSLADMNFAPENPVANMIAPSDNQIFNLGDYVPVEVDASDNDGIEKVEVFNGSDIIATLENAPYKYNISGLKDGTYHISVKVTDRNGNATQSSPAVVHINTPMNSNVWKSADIGRVYIEGNGHINADGSLTVKGNGNHLAQKNSVDNFHYVYQDGITGDCEISAKVMGLTDINNDAFAGIIIREDTTPNALGMSVGLSWDKSESDVAASGDGNCFKVSSKYKINVRDNKKGYDVVSKNSILFRKDGETVGYYIKIKKVGNVFTSYCSPDGEEWTEIDSREIPFKEGSFCVGFAADSNQDEGDSETKLYNLNTTLYTDINVLGDDIKDEPLLHPEPGDVTGDGKVTVLDAAKVMDYVLNKIDEEGNPKLTEMEIERANVSGNKNNEITALDASMILKKAIQQENFIFPVQNK